MRESLAYRAVFLVSSTAFLAFLTRGLSFSEFSTLQLLLIAGSISSALGEGVGLVAEKTAERNRFLWYTYLFLAALLVPLALIIAIPMGVYSAGLNFEVLALLSVYVALSTGLWGIIGPISALKPGHSFMAGIAFEGAKSMAAFVLVFLLRYGVSGALLSLILAQVFRAAVLSNYPFTEKTLLDFDLAKRIPLKWELFFLPLAFYFMTLDAFIVLQATGHLEYVGYFRVLLSLALILGFLCRFDWVSGAKMAISTAIFIAISMDHLSALLGPSYRVLSPMGPLVATVGILLAMNLAVDEKLKEDGTSLKILVLQNPLYLFTIYIIFKEWGGGLLAAMLVWLSTLMSFLAASLVVKWFILSKRGSWPIKVNELRRMALGGFAEGLVLFLLGYFILHPLEEFRLQAFQVVLLAMAGATAFFLTPLIETGLQTNKSPRARSNGGEPDEEVVRGP